MNHNGAPRSRGILLAVDGSRAAMSAASAAARVASALKWSIHAQYIVDVSMAFNLYADPGPELGWLGTDASSRQRIARFREWGTIALAEVEDLCRTVNVPIAGEIILGDVATTILNSAAEYPLLALGRRGNHHERELDSLGGNFRRIAQQSRTPLLIGGDVQPEFVSALLAYDGGNLSRKALQWAECLQAMFLEIAALSVEEADLVGHAWLRERQRQIADSSLVNCQFISQSGQPAPAIASTAALLPADMILMGGPPRSGLSEWITPSSFDFVLRHVGAAILATR